MSMGPLNTAAAVLAFAIGIGSAAFDAVRLAVVAYDQKIEPAIEHIHDERAAQAKEESRK